MQGLKFFPFFFFTLFYTSQAKVLIIHNEDIPLGEKLSKEYISLHQLQDARELGIPLPLSEKITWNQFQKIVKLPLRRHLQQLKKIPKVVLTTYGIPLFVQRKDKLYSLDQLLSLIDWQGNIGNHPIENPYFHRLSEPKKGLPLLVARLDAPTPKLAQSLIKRWALAKQFGLYRRFLPHPQNKAEIQLLKKNALAVQRPNLYEITQIHEIQYLELYDNSQQYKRLQASKKSLPPGAIVIHHHQNKFQYQKFRSYQKSRSSKALYLGASTFLGSQQIDNVKSDLFDSEHFWMRLLHGESYIEAVYGSLLSLGGSFIFIGDPLSRPFHSNSFKAYEQLFNTKQLSEQNKSFHYHLSIAKDWWLLYQYNIDWQQGNLDLSIAKLNGAMLLRPNPSIFKELLLNFHYQLGQTSKFNIELNKWKSLKTNSYEKNLIKYYESLKSALP